MINKVGNVSIPENYQPKIDFMETEIAIKKIKDYFQNALSKNLGLTRVSAPLFVDPDTGLNDNLSGVERTVAFTLKGLDEKNVEIVQSLAKWKRMALGKYGIPVGKGIYTDMNAIRRDEELDNIHSVYVDQWDWEKTIDKSQRTEAYLKEVVRKIYHAIKGLGYFIGEEYGLEHDLPEEIFFVTTQELEDRFPALSPKEREHAISKEKGAVFIMKIGGKLTSGEKHDGRAPDYDDWALNGDILIWDEMLQIGLELSSMGIRVDEAAMDRQLKLADAEDRRELAFHKAILKGELPYSIGGGIGQSRLCMHFLQKAHIGEVQVAVWPEDMIEICNENNIFLL